MKYSFSEYTTFELRTLHEAVKIQIKELEAFNQRVRELGPDMERLAYDRVESNKKKLEALYGFRVHILTSYQSVDRLEKANSN
jgi:hypothetical protein